MGRNKFRPTTGPWPEDGWRGWWGENPPFQRYSIETVTVPSGATHLFFAR